MVVNVFFVGDGEREWTDLLGVRNWESIYKALGLSEKEKTVKGMTNEATTKGMLPVYSLS